MLYSYAYIDKDVGGVMSFTLIYDTKVVERFTYTALLDVTGFKDK